MKGRIPREANLIPKKTPTGSFFLLFLRTFWSWHNIRVLWVVGFILENSLSPENFPVIWGKNFLTVPRQTIFFQGTQEIVHSKKKGSYISWNDIYITRKIHFSLGVLPLLFPSSYNSFGKVTSGKKKITLRKLLILFNTWLTTSRRPTVLLPVNLKWVLSPIFEISATGSHYS